MLLWHGEHGAKCPWEVKSQETVRASEPRAASGNVPSSWGPSIILKSLQQCQLVPVPSQTFHHNHKERSKREERSLSPPPPHSPAQPRRDTEAVSPLLAKGGRAEDGEEAQASSQVTSTISSQYTVCVSIWAISPRRAHRLLDGSAVDFLPASLLPDGCGFSSFPRLHSTEKQDLMNKRKQTLYSRATNKRQAKKRERKPQVSHDDKINGFCVMFILHYSVV